MELQILNNKGEKAGSVKLSEAFESIKGSPALLHEVVTAYLANQRSGTHSTKTRAEVSGGGIKPWKQKGTGRARSGSTRSPLWRKGGVIFGPKPRDYRQDLPKKKKQLAFKMAFKKLLDDSRVQIVEPIDLKEPKTKLMASVYGKWQAPSDSLFVVEKLEPKLVRAGRNISNVHLRDAESLNTYDCLRARKVFLTPAALKLLESRVRVVKEN